MTSLRFAIVAAAVLFPVAAAQAETSHRAATVSTLYGGELPAVVVGHDRAWVPTLTSQVALRLCAGGHCDAVRRVEQCDVPVCPGPGALAIAEHPVLDAGDYPRDRDGFYRERDAITSTPELAGVVGYLHEHPAGRPPAPHETDLQWLDDDFMRWRVETAFDASLGFSTPEGATVLGGEGRLALRYTWKPDSGDDDFIAVMFGNSFGPELTVRALWLPGANSTEAFTFGLGLATGYATRHWSVRAPSVYATLLPELGLVLRDRYPVSFYFGWSIPVSILVDPRVALEMRLTGLIVDDWVAGDDVAFVGMLSVGVVIR